MSAVNVRELMHQREALRSQKEALGSQGTAVLDRAAAEKRGLTADEERIVSEIEAKVDQLNAEIDRAESDIQRRDKFAGQGGQPVVKTDPTIGMTGKEVQRYSFVKAIAAAADQATNPRAWKDAQFELECSQAQAEKLGMKPQGFFVPEDVVMAKSVQRVYRPGAGWQYQDLRADFTSNAAVGGDLIATDLLSASFINLLRNQMMVMRAGARTLSGLVGNVAIPKQTQGATAYWVTDGNAPTESNQVVDQVPLTPKTCGAWTDITRKLLKQSSIDVEAFVREDLSRVVALAIDLAALTGDPNADEPTGILKTTGIGAVFAGGAAADGTNADGALPVWADIVNLETEVATDNADLGSLAYMVNAVTRGYLKQKPKVASTDSRMIWSDDPAAPLNGYPAYVTNQLVHTLTKGGATDLSAMIFGNWADLLIGMWGGLDVLVDPYTGGTAGTVRVIVLQDVDVAIRNVQSFAAGDDFSVG
jgi:HK97 family phage major capsid protein